MTNVSLLELKPRPAATLPVTLTWHVAPTEHAQTDPMSVTNDWPMSTLRLTFAEVIALMEQGNSNLSIEADVAMMYDAVGW